MKHRFVEPKRKEGGKNAKKLKFYAELKTAIFNAS